MAPRLVYPGMHGRQERKRKRREGERTSGNRKPGAACLSQATPWEYARGKGTAAEEHWKPARKLRGAPGRGKGAPEQGPKKVKGL